MRPLDRALNDLIGRRRSGGPDLLIEGLRRRLAGEPEILRIAGRYATEKTEHKITVRRGLLVAAGAMAVGLAVALPLAFLLRGGERSPASTQPTTMSPTTTTAAPASAGEVAPFHDTPDNLVVVSGTAICGPGFTAGVNPEGGPGLLMTCELDMSDPRVSGTETHNRFRNIDETGVSIVEEAVITNAGGTWRGTAQLVNADRVGGEAHYVGEGAYEGLEYHCYYGQLPEPYEDTTVIRGWISGGG